MEVIAWLLEGSIGGLVKKILGLEPGKNIPGLIFAAWCEN